MTPTEITQLAATWVQHHSALAVKNHDAALSQPNVETFCAFEKLDDLCRNNANLCWECILAIHHYPHNDLVTSCLAAGPLEDFLANFGTEIIALVEAQAAIDPNFKFLLGGIWRNSIASDIWARLEACRGAPW